MGKKKKKDKKNGFFDTIRDVEGLGVNDDLMSFIEKIDKDENDFDIPTVANEIRNRIKRGASVDEISWYKAKALKATLSYFRIDGRAKLTYKEDMAKELVKAFGGITDEHGKKSKLNNQKEKRDHNDDMMNMVIRNIKKKGGI